MFCQRGSIFFLLAVRVCVGGGGGGVRFSTSPSMKKVPKVTTSLIFFKDTSC